jgi:cbb3-type cytochrome c oxidase subunit III
LINANAWQTISNRRPTNEPRRWTGSPLCRSTSGRGGPGFPSLADRAWLWGGDPETIAETLRVGINDNHPDTRVSQMLAFGRDGLLDRAAVLDVVHYVQSLGRTDGDAEDDAEDDGRSQSLVEGQGTFAENCSPFSRLCITGVRGKCLPGKRDLRRPKEK